MGVGVFVVLGVRRLARDIPAFVAAPPPASACNNALRRCLNLTLFSWFPVGATADATHLGGSGGVPATAFRGVLRDTTDGGLISTLQRRPRAGAQLRWPCLIALGGNRAGPAVEKNKGSRSIYRRSTYCSSCPASPPPPPPPKSASTSASVRLSRSVARAGRRASSSSARRRSSSSMMRSSIVAAATKRCT